MKVSHFIKCIPKVSNISYEVGWNLNNWASEASPTLGCSIEISRDIYIRVYLSCPIRVGRISWPKHAHAQSKFWVVKTDL